MKNWLDRWHQDHRGRLVCSMKFDGFHQAIKFVNLVALEAEAQQHHPEIVIEYDRVTLSLITHDEGMVTVKDYGLAESITKIYDNLSG